MGTVLIGATSWNVYGDQNGAIAYLSGELTDEAAAWLVADSTTVQRPSLLTATRLLDRQAWIGTPVGTVDHVTAPGVLAWPRTGVSGQSGVPKELEAACYELAAALVSDKGLYSQLLSGSNVERVKAGPVEVEFFQSTLGWTGALPKQVFDLISLWLDGATVAGGGSIGSGVDGTEESAFDTDDRYDLSTPES